MKILNESILDIETFLKSKELIDQIKDLPSSDKCSEVVRICKDKFSDTTQPKEVDVTILSIGDDRNVDMIDDSHNAVKFNNFFYDYDATQFSDAFDVTKEDLPVIQPVVAESRLTSNISTIKRYAIIESE